MANLKTNGIRLEVWYTVCESELQWERGRMTHPQFIYYYNLLGQFNAPVQCMCGVAPVLYIANILSLSRVEDEQLITYNSRYKNGFVVHDSNDKPKKHYYK